MKSRASRANVPCVRAEEERVFRLIYKSRVARHVRWSDAQAIAARAASRNMELQLTGVLLYTSSHFIQAIEGEERRVREALQRISKDARHSDVEVVLEEQQVPRAFKGWAMRAVLPRKDLDAQAISQLGSLEVKTLLLAASE